MERLVAGRGILLMLPAVPRIRVLSGDISRRARQDCGGCQSPRLATLVGHLQDGCPKRAECVIPGHGA